MQLTNERRFQHVKYATTSSQLNDNNWTISMTTDQTVSTSGRPWDVGERSGKTNQESEPSSLTVWDDLKLYIDVGLQLVTSSADFVLINCLIGL